MGAWRQNGISVLCCDTFADCSTWNYGAYRQIVVSVLCLILLSVAMPQGKGVVVCKVRWGGGIVPLLIFVPRGTGAFTAKTV